MTCHTFLSYGATASKVVTDSDISSMSTAEFNQCLDEIGSTNGFGSTHWAAAAVQAKKVLTGACIGWEVGRFSSHSVSFAH